MFSPSLKRLGCTALAGVAATALATTAAPASQPQAPVVPPQVQVEAGNKPYLAGHAVGVQIYRCAAPGSWVLTAPDAKVYDEKGKVVMTHGAGPSWTARDGSTVFGRRLNGVNVDPTAIDWLLIEPSSKVAGADGDKLGKTTFIQRVNTVGGRATPSTCTAANVGAVDRVPYEADYVFWKKA